MIKIVSEEQILDQQFRHKVIKEINSDANQERKKKALKAYEIYKDLTRKWVIEAISKEFSAKTVEQMMNRAANISIARKIVDKKSKAYTGGVERFLKDEEENTKKLQELTKILGSNHLMKKADRFSELLKNIEIQALYENDTVDPNKKALVNRIMLPHQYDPLVHPHNCKTPIAYVLSDFHDTSSTIWNNLASDDKGYRESSALQQEKQVGYEGKLEKKATVYIWWSGKYHFTTNDKGKILAELSPEGNQNPIGRLNFTPVHADQDDSYWCDGGNDLIDGAVLINVLLTDMFSIMNIQGWGQLVITGKKIPSELTGGPHRALTFDYDTGDPVPKVDYVSSNPPLADWRDSITMYVALLLSTNNLSTKNVSTKLEGSANVISGVAMMIDEAESTESVEDKQNMFRRAEAQLWKTNFAALNYLFENGVANEELQQVGKIETAQNVQVKFNQQKPIMSEADRVDILAKKKDSGLYEIVDLIMIENPDLTKEDAEAKALRLIQDRIKYAALYKVQADGLVRNMNTALEETELTNGDSLEG